MMNSISLAAGRARAGSFMTEGSHQDHMVIVNVVKDFRPRRKPSCLTW